MNNFKENVNKVTVELGMLGHLIGVVGFVVLNDVMNTSIIYLMVGAIIHFWIYYTIVGWAIDSNRKSETKNSLDTKYRIYNEVHTRTKKMLEDKLGVEYTDEEVSQLLDEYTLQQDKEYKEEYPTLDSLTEEQIKILEEYEKNKEEQV